MRYEKIIFCIFRSLVVIVRILFRIIYQVSFNDKIKFDIVSYLLAH